MRHWHEVEDWLRDWAHDDVIACGAIRPTLVAFAGDRPLLVARWRPFERYEGPAALSELLGVTSPLGADRLAVAMGGRIRPLGDPTAPPGVDDSTGDALVIAAARRDDHTSTQCTLTPFEHSADGVQWGLPVASEAAAGWLPHMLAAAVRTDATRGCPPADVAARTLHCLVMGHEMHIPDDLKVMEG